MCHASFIWGVFLIANILFVKFCKHLLHKFNKEQLDFTEKLNNLVDLCLSFVQITDSKYIGLTIFMISNYFTGIVNLLVKETHQVTTINAYLINLLNSFVAVFIPFYAVYYFNNKKKIPKIFLFINLFE